MRYKRFIFNALFGIYGFGVLAAASGCGRGGDNPTDTLLLAAYTVPKEAYEREIIPTFQRHWQQKKGRRVVVQQSYEASGAQSRAVVGGFEADVVALSLEGDVDRIVEAGLITHDWHARPWNGYITRSLVVIGTRPDNPKAILDWADLARPDVEVLYPNPKTSGGAMWCVNAIWGAGLGVGGGATAAPDSAGARALVKGIQARVKVMDKSGRESVTTFERGIGDALVTYENELLLRTMQGRAISFVIPDATILIENPVAVVDRNVDKHGSREVAEEFVRFLHEEQAQHAFAHYGFRPASPKIMKEVSVHFPEPARLFTIADLGGWAQVRETLYGEDGVWTEVVQELARGR